MLYVPSGTPLQSAPQVHRQFVVMVGGHANTYQAIPHVGGEEGVYPRQNLHYLYTARKCSIIIHIVR